MGNWVFEIAIYKVRKTSFFDLTTFTGILFAWHAFFVWFIYFLWNFVLSTNSKEKTNLYPSHSFLFLKYLDDFYIWQVLLILDHLHWLNLIHHQSRSSCQVFTIVLKPLLTALLGLHFSIVLSLLIGKIDSFEYDLTKNKGFTVFQDFPLSFVIFVSKIGKIVSFGFA